MHSNVEHKIDYISKTINRNKNPKQSGAWGPKSPVGGVGVQSPHELGRLGERSPPNIIIFFNFYFAPILCFFFFAYVTDDLKMKKFQ